MGGRHSFDLALELAEAARLERLLSAAYTLERSAEAIEHTANPWTVVGILQPTHTAVDRAIYINLDSFYHIEGHELRASGGQAKEEKPAAEEG